MSHSQEISMTVNGRTEIRTVETRKLLVDFLREELGLTGTHVGCEHGICGACTVLVDGEAARACLMLAVQANSANVTTLEGLSVDGEELRPLQQAFKDHHALQCGFCTAGMLTTLTEVLEDNPDPTEAEIRIAISGNLCRCTGYQGIVDAGLVAAKILRDGRRP